ncbi:MAG: oligosaccharide flippase family protein [Methylophilus sp.]|nr:oligosaccharide flippase family protein [Methylophilus sp.]
MIISKLTSIKGELAWVLAGQGFALFGSLVGVKLLTNVMSQAAYGQLALGISIAGLMNMFLFGPLGQIILRYYSVSGERGEHAAYSMLLRELHGQLVLVVAVIGCVVVMIMQLTIGIEWAYLTAIAIFFGVVSGLLGSLQALFSAARERKLAALSQSADVWLRFLLAFLLVFMVNRNGFWALAGYSLGSLLVLLFQLRYMHDIMPYIKNGKSVGAEAFTRYRSEFWRYGTPFVAFAGFAVISQYADRWLLQGLAGAEQVGIYAVLYQIASAPITLLSGVVNQLVIPVVFTRAGALTHKSQIEHSRHLLKVVQLIMAVAFGVAVLIAAFWGKPLIVWITNESYGLHADILWLLVFGLAMFHLAQFMAAEGLSRNNSKLYFLPKLAQCLTLVIAGVFLTVTYGIWGMAVAFVISSFIHLFLITLLNAQVRNNTVKPAIQDLTGS